MESMFRSDFNEPMIFSKVAISGEDQIALSQMENSMKLVNGHYQLGLPWMHKSVNRPNNREFALGSSLVPTPPFSFSSSKTRESESRV